MKHRVVTTFHQAGYKEYGKRCIETFEELWPQQVQLLVFAEGVKLPPAGRNVEVRDQVKSLPTLTEFKRKYSHDPFMNGKSPWADGPGSYFWDAVRFANKVFAVTAAIRESHGKYDQLIWLDADTVTRQPLSIEFLDTLAPKGSEIAAILNRAVFPECGWVGYNLRHPQILNFAAEFEALYQTGAVKFMRESHDSYVFQRLLQKFVAKHGATWRALGDDEEVGHIFLMSELGDYLDHLKGPKRKSKGTSSVNDLRKGQPAASWLMSSTTGGDK